MTRPSTDIPAVATDTNLSSGPSSGSTTKVAFTSGELAQGFVPGQRFKSRRWNWVLNLFYQWLLHADTDYNAGAFGNGTGSFAPAGPLTLPTSGPLYFETMTINSGVELIARHPIYVNGTLTINAGGKITQDGGDAPTPVTPDGALGGTGAVGDAAGAGAGGDGGEGAANDNVAPYSTAASAGESKTNALGGSGGAGGNDNATPSASLGTAGAAGTRTLPTAQGGPYRNFRGDLGWNRTGAIMGGAGGGGGGVDDDGALGSDYGGGGGGGAGVVIIVAREIINNGQISADGGDGADGITDTALAGGGGGGGGGGYVALAYRKYSGSGTVTASGGSGGSGTDTGLDGADGAAGTVYQFQI